MVMKTMALRNIVPPLFSIFIYLSLSSKSYGAHKCSVSEAKKVVALYKTAFSELKHVSEEYIVSLSCSSNGKIPLKIRLFEIYKPKIRIIIQKYGFEEFEIILNVVDRSIEEVNPP